MPPDDRQRRESLNGKTLLKRQRAEKVQPFQNCFNISCDLWYTACVGKVNMSLKISIIAALLIIGTANFLGVNEWLTLGQFVRIYSLLAGSVVGASIYAVRTIKKLIEKVEKKSGTSPSCFGCVCGGAKMPRVRKKNSGENRYEDKRMPLLWRKALTERFCKHKR